MTAIQKMVDVLTQCRKEVMDKGMGYQGATDMVLCLNLLEDKARHLDDEEAKEKPMDYNDAQKRYYNEAARNSVLYDLCDDLISELDKVDCNNPLIERAEKDLGENGFSFGKPESHKPQADASLVEELSKFIECELRVASTQTHREVHGFRQALNQVSRILSRYRPTPAKAVEPLAVLADRKGFWKVGFTRSCDAMAKDFWVCVIQKLSFDIRIDKQRDYDFVAPTYPTAESKARAFLNSLPDKEAR